jgi:hypothetical protein
MHLYLRPSVFMSLLLLGMLTLPDVTHAAKEQKYYWSSYARDHFLLANESGPTNEVRFEATLQSIISKSVEANRKPPPGLMAEYGYLFYKRGEFNSAIEYFESERRDWPESGTLMAKMIQQAQKESGL